MDGVLVALLLVVVFVGLGVAIGLLVHRGAQPGAVDGSALGAKLDLLDTETRRLHEQMARLDGVPQAMTALQLQTNQLAARMTPIEAVPNAVSALRLETSKVSERLLQFDPVTKTLNDVRTAVADLTARVHARQAQDSVTAESVRRLEMIIAGTQSKGAAGENMVEVILTALPVEWQVRDYRIQNLVVEFGLRLPTGLVLPIDSKWSGADLVEKFSTTIDPEAQAAIKRQIEQGVLSRAREVAKYIDPEQTPGFGLAVVPDAVYDLSLSVTPRSFTDHRVVVVSYSLLVPYLLMIVQTAIHSSQTIDVQKLESHLSALETTLEAMRREVESRLSRATKALTNSRDALGGLVGRARSNINNIRAIGAATGALELAPIIADELDASDPDGDDDLLDA